MNDISEASKIINQYQGDEFDVILIGITDELEIFLYPVRLISDGKNLSQGFALNFYK